MEDYIDQVLKYGSPDNDPWHTYDELLKDCEKNMDALLESRRRDISRYRWIIKEYCAGFPFLRDVIREINMTANAIPDRFEV